MKVLVPLDGSELAENMLGVATLIAEEIHLVRVAPGPKVDLEAERYLEEQREKLEMLGAKVRWDLELGDPAERITVIAREQQPDLIAMATHGATARARSVRGSVAERVLRESCVPLFLANPRGLRTLHSHTFEKALLPHDGSSFSDQIFPLVERLAQPLGIKQAVLLRVQPSDPVIQKAFDPAAVVASMSGQKERLEAAGLQVKAWAGLGDEAEEILRAANENDLVALCTHGRSGISRWWFGSVAEEVLRHCDRPLIVVRPQAE